MYNCVLNSLLNGRKLKRENTSQTLFVKSYRSSLCRMQNESRISVKAESNQISQLSARELATMSTSH